jgi:hypothetical protein
MDRKKMLVVALSVAGLFLACAVTARSPPTSTPLYTIRMEQASSEMNFLPTAVSTFTYTTEKGYDLPYAGCCGVPPSSASETYEDCTTIEITCWSCWNTCLNTCPNTCRTCPQTCPNTCTNTCPNTCTNTCPNTCWNTCPNTCWDTCWNTCEYTCEGPECTTIEITCWTCYSC